MFTDRSAGPWNNLIVWFFSLFSTEHMPELWVSNYESPIGFVYLNSLFTSHSHREHQRYCCNICFKISNSGFVDVPYLVLEPTHNKQDFADAKVRIKLLHTHKTCISG